MPHISTTDDLPGTVVGYVNPDGSGNGNWSREVAASATCGASAPVTAGAGATDTGTCYRPAHGDEVDHDYQVEPPTVVQPWSPGDRHPAGKVLDQVERRGEGWSVEHACPQCGRDLRIEPHHPAATSQECWRNLASYKPPAEEVVLDCGFCVYGIDYHTLTPGGFVCPTEDQARAMAGDR